MDKKMLLLNKMVIVITIADTDRFVDVNLSSEDYKDNI